MALISGAIADRAKFTSWALFVPVWITLVYCPLAFMVWGGGLMSAGGAVSAVFGQVIDFAGGTVVEISSGTAALVLVLILGNRHGFGKDPSHRPHNIPFIMLGAGILWFGWFGFNAGAATTAEQAGLIWVNTLAAPAAAMLSWLVTEKVRHGHPTSLGAASGAVAGLVAITPSCANISPLAALGLGLVAGAACAVFVDLKYKFGFDDSLDVVGVHLGAGLIGTLALGFIALPVDGAGGGLFYGGGLQQLIAQTVAVLITVALSGLVTAVIGLAIHKTLGFRVSHEDETRRRRPVRARRDRLRLRRTRSQPVQPVRPPCCGARRRTKQRRATLLPVQRRTLHRVPHPKGKTASSEAAAAECAAASFSKGPVCIAAGGLRCWAGGTRISELA